MVLIHATGRGIITRTPTRSDIQNELRIHSEAGWRLVQILTLGVLYRKTRLVLERKARNL